MCSSDLTVIKGHYDNYSEFIAVHPSGSLGDAYIVDGSYYYWNENGWANAGSVKGGTGATGEKGQQGPKEILEIQELLAILDRPGQRGTLELLALALLLKVHMILTRN